MRPPVRPLGDAEPRHLAWGTCTCRRHGAAEASHREVVRERLDELLPHVLSTVEEGDTASDTPEIQRYELPPGELLQYATDRALRRLGAIESARGVPLTTIDVDAEPEEWEARFGAEDRKTMEGLLPPHTRSPQRTT